MASNTAAGSVLLLGSNGQLGHELQRTLARLGSVVALDIPSVDFSHPESLRAIVRDLRPRAIVNSAAYTAVDKAEAESELAFAINAVAPGILAEEAQALDACLVHYSTDYVFDGSKASPYVEGNVPNPLSVYGKTKLEGERAVQKACSRSLIFRTSWVVGVHGNNFVKTMLRLAAERPTLRVVADQFGAPTAATLLAECTAEVLAIMADRPRDDSRWGLYHLVASGKTTWHGLAQHVIARAHAKGLSLMAGPGDVVPVTTAEYPTAATRPANSRLDTGKFRSVFSIDLPDWSVGVDSLVDQLILEMQR